MHSKENDYGLMIIDVFKGEMIIDLYYGYELMITDEFKGKRTVS